MSQRNGDKARFGKDRKSRIARRKRNRELREKLGYKTTTPASAPSEEIENRIVDSPDA